MSASDLPLFSVTENRENLRRLQERRDALLKRLHALPPQSRRRAGLAYELAIVTTEMIQCEIKAGGHHVR
ncbi:hypothetical protein [Martelella radicis]|uniref:Uncharacterized protein n=1 Tax=Martelella radicis TaxID=1397476 RepID=A0A7W6PAJ8_9HYPH|nr:hypothetical protein [Martelella radicis]MBB4122935.1 hypothetical protein [Martelella radicis]